jgi:DNA mismatch repair protein MutS
MMQQYQELKRRYPDYLLLFRLGDFYEMFAEDAHLGARLLQITLTARAVDTHGRHPASRRRHLYRQADPPGPEGGGVRADGGARPRQEARATRGGARHHAGHPHRHPDAGRRRQQLSPRRSPRPRGRGRAGRHARGRARGGLHRRVLAGEETGAGEALLEAALLRRPAEILVSGEGDEALRRALAARGVPLTLGDPDWFRREPARERLRAHFSGESLEGFGVGGLGAGLQAAGAALAYLRETQGDRLGHLTRLLRFSAGDALGLDQVAVATLELFETAQERAVKGSLIGLLDGTRTPMGARALRQWLLRPLRDVPAISRRQEAVGALVDAPEVRAALRARLQGIGDIERLASRAALGVAHARDLVGLRGVAPGPAAPPRSPGGAGRAPLRRYRRGRGRLARAGAPPRGGAGG